jgi:hypothetical protein
MDMAVLGIGLVMVVVRAFRYVVNEMGELDA